jgi:4-amino-4-deoxy-L-arabinose transferase-like glycosyltransferase
VGRLDRAPDRRRHPGAPALRHRDDIANGEAYYYVWSRFPALSYYDHPPLVAWMTWLTTRGSHGSLAVRAGPLVCSVVFGALVYLLGRRLFSPRAGFLAVAIVTVIPVFFVSSYALNPEAPLAPLWVLGLLLLNGMREHDEPWRPLAAGAVSGLAFLAKYSGVLVLGVGLLYVLVSPQGRRWLRRPSLYLGSLVALAIAAPVLVWNQQRGWPSLVLHLRRAHGTRGRSARWPSTPGMPVVGQLGPLNPLIFPALLAVLVVCIRRSSGDDRFRFLALAELAGPPLLLGDDGPGPRRRVPLDHGGLPSPGGGRGWAPRRACGATPGCAPVVHRGLPGPHPRRDRRVLRPTPETLRFVASSPPAPTTRTATSSTR